MKATYRIALRGRKCRVFGIFRIPYPISTESTAKDLNTAPENFRSGVFGAYHDRGIRMLSARKEKKYYNVIRNHLRIELDLPL